MGKRKKEREFLTTGSEWNEELLETFYSEIERIADEYLHLDTYPNQIEVISSEQMIDAYSSHAMPLMYNHWSYGKSFISTNNSYKRGRMGLAYEVVINSSPCIAYLMEENSMLMQALVMAHASFGHNCFFKNNYMFKEWTDAEAIIDYLNFAKKYIAQCETKYGEDEVEAVIDSCHALQYYGVDKYKRPPRLSMIKEKAQAEEREAYRQSQANALWDKLIPHDNEKKETEEGSQFPSEPQENILYFVEKNAPHLPTWKREIIRIVRKISQYFYPQMQTKLMNEGFATFTHYNIIHKMYDEGLIDDGYMLEFYVSHTGVIAQPDYDSKYFSGINIYALGFAMFQDIKRVCIEPTDEDREWFRHQEWVGKGDWKKTTLWAMESFKDESFVMQFLSPKVMRDFHLFSFVDDDEDPELEITAIHNKQGYRYIREALANQYNITNMIPEIQVTNVDVRGDRSLTLQHTMRNRRPLHKDDMEEVLKHLSTLWGFDVTLESIDTDGEIRARYHMSDDQSLVDLFSK